MPEYDDFAEPYLLWTVSPVPYRAIELYSFFNVLGSVAGCAFLISPLATAASRAR